MVAKVSAKKASSKKIAEVEEDYSLNDVLLRGRVSQEAVEKELPDGIFLAYDGLKLHF